MVRSHCGGTWTLTRCSTDKLTSQTTPKLRKLYFVGNHNKKYYFHSLPILRQEIYSLAIFIFQKNGKYFLSRSTTHKTLKWPSYNRRPLIGGKRITFLNSIKTPDLILYRAAGVKFKNKDHGPFSSALKEVALVQVFP